ncbi:MAG: antibiotic biosynthesis monooxygenase [Pseudomonadales bacterium]|nr:antibiotic biosynthesis monooxygenase [Pseudomonadales bacterium]
MIIVHGIIPIKANQRDKALSLAREMSDATQTESGCISYEFYVGLRDPNTLILLQEWENMEALAGHLRTEHMKVFLDELPDVLAGQVHTRRYAVQSEPEPADKPQPEPSQPIIH